MKKTKTIIALLVCAFALFLQAQPAFAHGTVTVPPSRVWRCYQDLKSHYDTPSLPACKAAASAPQGSGKQAFYDWNGIRQENANDRHEKIIPNGHLPSADVK